MNMKMTQSTKRGRVHAAPGFTLVELLTVIFIIALLIGILVPALSTVRARASAAATSATISTLSTGLETFRADQQLGGAYPPSASDHADAQGRLTYRVQNPYDPPTALPPQQPPLEISGASLLVWALLGADFLGTPGFKPFRSNSQYWAQDTHAGVGCAYEIDQTPGRNLRPLKSRVGPFVDAAKVKVTPRATDAQRAAIGQFDLETEGKACDSAGVTRPKRDFPFFLDSFGNPILYWRADIAGTWSTDVTPNLPLGQNPNLFRANYHFLDNGALVARGADLGAASGAGTAQTPLLLSTKSAQAFQNNQRTHPLTVEVYNPGQTPAQAAQNQTRFGLYIQNKNNTSGPTAFKADSYILVSAGADGLYGTADDITNFEHNGASILP